jgi:hypothetical protein
MSWLAAALSLRTRRERALFEACRSSLAAMQEGLLLQMVRRNERTAFGRDHGFRSIRSADAYRRAVPLGDYARLRPYIERLLDGEGSVLTADPVIMLVTTSGTTAEPKQIPVTAAWRAELAGLMRLWLYYATRAHPGSFAGSALMVTGPAIEGFTARGLPHGAMSGVAQQRLPRLVARQFATPLCVSLVAEPEVRYFLTMRIAMARRVTVMGTPQATTLLRLAEVAAENAPAIIKAMHDGGLGIERPRFLPHASAAKSLRELEAWCTPQPARARALETLMKDHGCLRPRDYWPEIKLIGCWLGSSAGFHARMLEAWYGAVPLRDLGLLASEGRMTLPMEDSSPAGCLTAHRSYFELIPEGQLDQDSPTVLPAHQLQLHARYSLVITGRNGLWRYDMNDLVEVCGFAGELPQVAFVRKAKDVLSVTGEKVHVDQFHIAVRDAQQATGLEVWQFRLVGDTTRVAHDLLIEIRGDASLRQLRLFLQCFDGRLQELNCEYLAKRSSGRLRAPRLHAMRPGWSERQCQEDFRRGRREHQYKWPAISETWNPSSRDEVVSVTGLEEDGQWSAA